MKTFTYKVDILNIARYDLPKTFAPRTIHPLIFTNFNEYTEYCESISKNIHRTHITLDEFGRVPMFQIMLDDQEIIGMSTDYVIDYEEPFIPNNDSYYLFTFIWNQAAVTFDVPDDFDASNIKWIVENYYSYDWDDPMTAFYPNIIEYNGELLIGKVENIGYDNFCRIALFQGDREIRYFQVDSGLDIEKCEMGG
jgi:hypothetical protein